MKDKMKKKKSIVILIIIIVICALLGITLAYAMLSQRLTINGTGVMEKAEWNIHLTDLEKSTVEGDAKVLVEPTISSDEKRIENFKFSLKKPGDLIVYNFNIRNDGQIAAKLSKQLINGLDLSEVENLEENSGEFMEFMYKFLDSAFPKADYDGDGITTREERIKAYQNIRFGVSTGSREEISIGNRIPCTLEVYYIQDAEEIPKGELEININEEFIYVQK